VPDQHFAIDLIYYRLNLLKMPAIQPIYYTVLFNVYPRKVLDYQQKSQFLTQPRKTPHHVAAPPVTRLAQQRVML
jgi:hypothetical protein